MSPKLTNAIFGAFSARAGSYARVSIFAMCLAFVGVPNVFGVCDNFEMGRIDTVPYTAQVVNLETDWDGAVKQFPHHPMCSVGFAAIRTMAVAFSVDGACPKPTVNSFTRVLFETGLRSHPGIRVDVTKCAQVGTEFSAIALRDERRSAAGARSSGLLKHADFIVTGQSREGQ